MSLTNTTPIRLVSPLLLLAMLGGCAVYDDPFNRPGTWRAENTNDANLAAMVNDKRHLSEGVGDTASPAVLSAQAVHRLLTDHVKPLPTTELNPLSSSSQAGGGS
jgi:hypothetical protein